MMDKVAKIFGKKKFKGEGHKLGNKAEISKSPSEEKAARSRDLGHSQQRPPFTGKAHILSGASGREPPGSSPQNPPARTDQSPRKQNVAATQCQAGSGGPARMKASGRQNAANAASEDLQVAMIQLEAAPQASKDVLKKMLSNITSHPAEAKFRRVRLANPRIKTAIVDVDGALELLQAVGFQLTSVNDSDDVHLTLLLDEDLTQTQAAVALLDNSSIPASSGNDVLPHCGAALSIVPQGNVSPPQTSDSQQEIAVQPCDRETQVLLPAAVGKDEEVPDWIFQRSPAELKAGVQAAQRKRQQDEMLMTKAMRERLSRGSKPHYSFSTVRVKLPEGLYLQGKFGSKEAVGAIFAWFTACLADPGSPYELILPDRKPLDIKMGTLRSANLLPSILLLYRSPSQAAGKEQFTLKSKILATL